MIVLGTLDKVAIPVGSSRNLYSPPAREGPGVGSVVSIHIVSWRRLFPNGSESFVVDRAYLVDAAQGTVRLSTSRVVVRCKEPLKMSADTVFDALCQTRLCLQELCKRLLTVFRITMQVDGTPSPVFTIQQLVRAF